MGWHQLAGVGARWRDAPPEIQPVLGRSWRTLAGVHHEVGVALGADVMNDGDVGVIQRSGSPSLLLEPGQPLRVGGVG